MRWDFTNVSETEDFASVPPGWYTVRIEEIREGVTRDGDPRWGFCLVVSQGEYAGRIAAWDGIVWNDRCAPRAKRVLEILGVDSDGEVELEPHDLKGRRADVVLVPEEWEHPVTGRRQKRNRVPYHGYAPEGSAEERHGAETEGLPMVVSEVEPAVDGWGGQAESCNHESAPCRSELRSS